MGNKIKVIVIDDSAFMRKSLSLMLESDEEIQVIATARDGEEGYKLVKNLKPDLVTLDIEMPKMDGLTALQIIMKDSPTPVIMVSSLTTEGAEATIKALENGAVDFIPKELSYTNVNIIKIKEELIRKVKEIVRQSSLNERIRRLIGWRTALNEKGKQAEIKTIPVSGHLPKIGYKAICLGISTGGPMSLQKVIPNLENKISCPIFIVQHMPPKFTKSLADRLNGMSSIGVREAENNEKPKNGVIYVAPGGFHMILKENGKEGPRISISEEPNTTLHRPSVDVMINSVVDVYGKYAMGIIMTGMGKDGLEGIKKIKSLGGYCLVQNEESCIVYGMPRSVVEAGLADVVVPLENIAETINNAF
ncbi:MAG: protein-glutamate methylesterase/protein-glutamine glutaminase [Ignavibacteria bacterium]